jgi:hypothetical protein
MYAGKTLLVALVGLVGVALFAGDASAGTSWNIAADWSGANNPNGAWSYGRKWNMEDGAFDLMTIKWTTNGWLMVWGQPWAPSMAWEGDMWANDNSNGYPVIRWTCPQDGSYSLDTTFTGYDARGVDTLVYVTVNGTIAFADHIEGHLDTTQFSSVYDLAQGDYIDFSMKWSGVGNPTYNWTMVSATIAEASTLVPVPGAMLLGTLGTGLVGLLRRRSAL